MADDFSDIPSAIIDYVRKVFAAANDKVSQTVGIHPSMHEETLDHMLVMELIAAPPAFFATERAAVSIESHWLGGRAMFYRWEIADIAFFVLLRRNGRLLVRKVALAQTKRLYSREMSVDEIDPANYRIGIGRLVDRTDPQIPLSSQRAFTFDEECVYGATNAGHMQITHIVQYMLLSGIPVYYLLYNPNSIPFKSTYPPNNGAVIGGANAVGCRIIQATSVHAAISKLDEGTKPTLNHLKFIEPIDFSRRKLTIWVAA